MVTKNKQGRPRTMKNGEKMNVYMCDETKRKARLIGGGNLSAGVRKAILKYKEGEK